jgi:hypothetical protein
MTASRPHKAGALALALLIVQPFCGAALMAQDAGAQDNTETDQETLVAEETEVQPLVAPPAINPQPKKLVNPQAQVGADGKARTLYFFGGRPTLQRQQGPALSAPTSILPQPYIPKGSVTLPPAPMVATDVSEQEDLPIETDNPVVDSTELSLGLSPIGEEPEQIDSDYPLPADVQTPAQEGVGAPDPVGESLEAGMLEALDPSGIALIAADEGYDSGIWQGYDRAAMINRFGDFASPASSPALKAIANRFALSGTTPDAPVGDSDIIGFIEARLELLTALGNNKGYADLLLALPAGYDWSPLARHFANAYLLEGKIADACDLAGAQRENDADPYWLKLIAFCEAANGNRAGVDFQLGILEEISDIEPTFYQLVDQILLEAELPPGAVMPAPATLPTGLRIDVLEATMARLARVNIEGLAIDNVNPLAVQMMIGLPGVTPAAKTDLVGLAVRRGWVAGEMFAVYASNMDASPDAIAAAEAMALADNSFDVDAVFAKAAALPGTDDERAVALQRFWARIAAQNYTAIGGAGLDTLIDNIAPMATGAAPVMARSAIAAGKPDEASAWYRALRSQQVGTNPENDKNLVMLAPLMALAADGPPQVSQRMLAAWWQAQANDETRYGRANLLFTVLEALGTQVSDEAWMWLEDGPVKLAGAAPAPAQWRRFLIASRNKDVPATIASLFRLLSDGGPAGLSASVAGSIVGTLQNMELTGEARMIATEILIGQGL